MMNDPLTAAFYPLSPEALKAVDAIEYITDHLKKEEEHKMVLFRFILTELIDSK